jgi:hypothetical protein
MLFSLFKYANFIHHYSDHGKQEENSAPKNGEEKNSEN